MNDLLIYIYLFLLSFFLTYFIRIYSIKKNLVDEINERSSHTTVTPHGGGIAISVTWFIGLFYLELTNEIDNVLFYALLPGIIISIVSYFDDLYNLSPKIRLLIQTAVAVSSLYLLGGFDSFGFEFFNINNQFFTNIIAFFIIIWFINLYNFLDGINGYAGIEIVFLSIAGLVFFGGNYFIILIVATLGFLLWNYGNRAKIFMGDVGSTLLGFNIAIFTIYNANQNTENFWIWIGLFGLFLFDATYTLLKRKINKEKISQAHKKHGYQRLNQSGWSHLKISNYSIVINAIIFLLFFLIPSIIVSFLLSFLFLCTIMLFINNKKRFLP